MSGVIKDKKSSVVTERFYRAVKGVKQGSETWLSGRN